MPIRKIEASLVYMRRRESREVLMLHRIRKDKDLHEGKWNGIGGKCEKGEDPYACARREITEESGLVAQSLHFCGHLFFPSFDKQGNDWSVFVFSCDDFLGELNLHCPEGELHWIKEDDLLDLNLWEGDRSFLPHVLQGQRFFGAYTYENKQLKNWHLDLIN